LDSPDSWLSLDQVQSIRDWAPAKPEALLNIVVELIEHFKIHQSTLIKSRGSQAIQFEWSMIHETSGLEPLYVPATAQKPSEVHFLIPLMGLSSDAGLEPLKLFVRFFPEAVRGPETRFSYTLGSNWEIMLMGAKMPVWAHETSIVPYLESVKNMAKTLSQERLNRKKLLQTLSETLGVNSLEHDAYNYQKISFAFDVHSWNLFVHFSIPVDFPAKQPTIILHSMRELKRNFKPYERVENDYPYSPRWGISEFCTRIKAWLIEVSLDFKKQVESAL